MMPIPITTQLKFFSDGKANSTFCKRQLGDTYIMATSREGTPYYHLEIMGPEKGKSEIDLYSLKSCIILK